jgi:hypothetical protein
MPRSSASMPTESGVTPVTAPRPPPKNARAASVSNPRLVMSVSSSAK